MYILRFLIDNQREYGMMILTEEMHLEVKKKIKVTKNILDNTFISIKSFITKPQKI